LWIIFVTNVCASVAFLKSVDAVEFNCSFISIGNYVKSVPMLTLGAVMPHEADVIKILWAISNLILCQAKCANCL